MLAKLSDNKNGKYWYKILGEAEYVLNNTVHKTTETPSKLLFGVNQRGTIIISVIAEYLEESKVNNKDDDLKQLKTRPEVKENVKTLGRVFCIFAIKSVKNSSKKRYTAYFAYLLWKT